MAKIVLPHSFFDRPVLEVCKDLLGKFLVIKKQDKEIGLKITEIEAYDGQEDEACHARHGKTERNAPMFGKPGCRYVYLCYGMYRMLNIVTGPGAHPSAILIRAVESPNNLSPFAKGEVRRTEGFENPPPQVVPLLGGKGGQNLNGPGKLTKRLGVTKKYNAEPANEKTGLRIEDRGAMVTHITQKPRVGIDYAGKWAKKNWRFIMK